MTAPTTPTDTDTPIYDQLASEYLTQDPQSAGYTEGVLDSDRTQTCATSSPQPQHS